MPKSLTATGWPIRMVKTFRWLSFDIFGSWSAISEATCCSGRMAEHPKSKSTGGFTKQMCHPVQVSEGRKRTGRDNHNVTPVPSRYVFRTSTSPFFGRCRPTVTRYDVLTMERWNWFYMMEILLFLILIFINSYLMLMIMRDDMTPGRGITENIPPEACKDQPKAVDR